MQQVWQGVSTARLLRGEQRHCRGGWWEWHKGKRHCCRHKRHADVEADEDVDDADAMADEETFDEDTFAAAEQVKHAHAY